MLEVEEAKLRYADKRKACRETDTCLKCGGPATVFKTDINFLDFLYWSRHCQECQEK